MKLIDICLTPELLHLYSVKDRVVVVVDILRATSCMTTAFAHGVEKIIPVATLEECRALQNQGLLAAAERDAKKADGFDLDNSPFSYMDEKLIGQTIAMTTTNGTQAITKSKEAIQVIIGSFLNKTAIINYLQSQPHHVLILCAGWKGRVNLEDTLFAGAVADELRDGFTIEDDASLGALTIYSCMKYNMLKSMASSSHVKRLHRLNLAKDIEFCIREDLYNVIPVLEGDGLVKMKLPY
ncbi:2-phosphosulfolactate phosphatase [Rhodocytophaga aerolata]|uniref:Probable 2-phosphosulfolactate phosphatase n=1 Tax=Rhodocytophaga aerolata TaxID=455078 RepID=A0ABT8R9I7_9BACT|nr:2-phosphosulfolactate phosphatase [Rhodocytophaga aerolata]MDO1448754.1 2-phosphosulfolactate phosphatase [Rhodocytophaga aerolata]